jgi:hypothetical protein
VLAFLWVLKAFIEVMYICCCFAFKLRFITCYSNSLCWVLFSFDVAITVIGNHLSIKDVSRP